MILEAPPKVHLSFLPTFAFLAQIANARQFLVRKFHQQLPMDKRKTLTFPSNNSRLAPPPVLTWLSFFSALYCATTVAVSPPPTMTTAPFLAASILASRRALDPSPKAVNSNTPGGLNSFVREWEGCRGETYPFQRMVLASKTVFRNDSRLFSPTSNPIQLSGMPSESDAIPTCDF